MDFSIVDLQILFQFFKNIIGDLDFVFDKFRLMVNDYNIILDCLGLFSNIWNVFSHNNLGMGIVISNFYSIKNVGIKTIKYLT